jgi:lipopolysaccharide heptosyltransferase II
LKILILKPSSLGDIVQGLPVLRAIKRHLPRSEVYWWIDRNLAPLLAGDPDLAGLIPFERRRWATPANWIALWGAARWMRRQRFDLVIDLQCLMRSGIFAWLANGKLTIGLDEPREGARGFYDLIAPRPSFHTHAVDWYLGVLPLAGVPMTRDFEWLPPRPGLAASLRRKWPVQPGPWLIVQPGARWPNKRWPIEYFAELVRQAAARRKDWRFAILGSADERPLGEAIARVVPARCLDLTGRLSLPEMVEWIRLGAAMVANDTGPMHVAAALGKPVVGLFGPTEPRRHGPYGQLGHVLQANLPCVPCLKSRCTYAKPLECLRLLSPAAALEALERRLDFCCHHPPAS